MNCRRIEKLIPLYVEGDLGVDEAGAVTSHALTCAGCNRLVAEYEQSQRWLRSYTPPDFDDASLRDLKLDVLREIKGRRTRVTLLDKLAGPWMRRLVIATSAAFLIILAALAFNVYRHETNQASGHNDVAAGGDAEPGKRTPEVAPLPQVAKEAPRAGFVRKRRHRPPNASRGETVAARLKNRERLIERPAVNGAEHARAGDTMDSLAGEGATSPGMLRIEIQTSDPSIRIIWFSPKESTAHQAKPTTESD